ncbi:hypothetical protein ACFOQM_14965 [Paenibacillus sp. GCM10012307]|uniref:Uncharacterized protein n=1 Tax=Paenibacillus roseus TaxID=2798579 RepID=A0A934J950_9BACL|nr:hypothetical protein [Paenibacillus roseus]MBJ6362563.1 hypothetical protein [Paenibacillus roseus]
MRRSKKPLFSIVFAIVVLSIFLSAYNFPKTIDVTYSAVQFSEGDLSSAQETSVQVEGTLSRPLFGESSFRGKLSVEGDEYEYTKSYELIDVVFHKEIRNGFGGLTYTSAINGKPDLKLLGALWIRGAFDQMKLQVNDPGSSDPDFITAPAANLEEARKIKADFDNDGKK